MTANTIPAAERKASVESIQPLLASSLYMARIAKHAHWNVTGPNFIGIHRLLDEVYEAAEDWADSLAERIRGLGGTALGTPDQMIEGSLLKLKGDYAVENQEEYIDLVASSLGLLSKAFRVRVEALDDSDPGTSNMLQDLTLKADHFIYLLESHRG